MLKGTRVLSVNHSLARAVQGALTAGYRHIDTASLYRVEDEVGLGIRWYLNDTTKRQNIYVTTKVKVDIFVPLLRCYRRLYLRPSYMTLNLFHS